MGQRGSEMSAFATRMGRERALKMFADLTDRIESFDNPAWCKQGSDNKFRRIQPARAIDRAGPLYNPTTKRFTVPRGAERVSALGAASARRRAAERLATASVRSSELPATLPVLAFVLRMLPPEHSGTPPFGVSKRSGPDSARGQSGTNRAQHCSRGCRHSLMLGSHSS